MAAARAARGGASLEEVVAIAQSVAERQHTFAMLDTLEWARRGGRISRIEAALGSLLNLKPILSVKTEIQSVGRARTRAAALKRMFDLAMSYANITHVGVMYATTPEDAEMIAEWVRTSLPEAHIEIVRTGPALGAHGGPGIMGMTVVEGKKEA
jgi:DegV family protein with EDD domain